jgi:hypothetical protein
MRSFVTICAVLALAACSSGDGSAPPAANPPPANPAPAPPPTTERSIAPQTTNAALTQDLLPHFVINPNPAVPAKNRLFVFLPGTGAPPSAYEDIVRAGAAQGYHALGLTYVNDDAVGVLCPAAGDPACAGAVRREVITGEATSALVAVDAANSIDGRLRSLLAHLAANFPAEGWGRYLVNGDVDWSITTVAGHSQGAGHAGFMAKIRDLNRVVMFSGPGDAGAAWQAAPNVTPVARQFGFTHTADNLTPLAVALGSWDAIDLDLFGAPVSVDGVAAPFGGAHQLTTSAPPNPNPVGPSASPTHGAPVVDSVTPRDAQGAPLYLPVWTHVAFP